MAGCSSAAIRRGAWLGLGLARTGVVVPSDPRIARRTQTPAPTWLDRLSQLVVIARLRPVEHEPHWICCQIGAREHYSIPRALFRKEALRLLITDAWGRQRRGRRSGVSGQRGRFAGRWHEELRDAPVISFNWSLIGFELLARARGLTGWHKVMARNEWFQRKVVGFLSRSQLSTLNSQPIFFSYSYAARDIFRFAKQRGWKTVLGQIDPGPFEEEIVAKEVARVPELAPNWRRAPRQYWDSWREECELADRIVVNSEWARTGLLEAGVNGEKLSVIPLAYEMSEGGGQGSEVRGQRQYPDGFDEQRPLRVLFLGQVNLRKGVARLFDAIRLLKGEPIEFQFVGPVQVAIPNDIRANPRVQWFGTVSRSETASFYQNADVLIFPTLSDGFGLTQLEAQAWGLPVIASRDCGDVVHEGVNGLRLPDLSGESIAHALRHCLCDPDRLRTFAENAIQSEKIDLNGLAQALLELSEPRSHTVSIQE